MIKHFTDSKDEDCYKREECLNSEEAYYNLASSFYGWSTVKAVVEMYPEKKSLKGDYDTKFFIEKS